MVLTTFQRSPAPKRRPGRVRRRVAIIAALPVLSAGLLLGTPAPADAAPRTPIPHAQLKKLVAKVGGKGAAQWMEDHGYSCPPGVPFGGAPWLIAASLALCSQPAGVSDAEERRMSQDLARRIDALPGSDGTGQTLPATSGPGAYGTVTGGGLPLRVRSGPSTNNSQIGTIPDGSTVRILCTVRGQTVTGRWGSSSVWDLVDAGPGYPSGLVSDGWVYTGSQEPVAAAC